MPAGTTFCDVGGGIGSVSMALVKAHPHLKVTLQDLPNVIEQASEVSLIRCTSSHHPYGYIHSVLVQRMSARHPGQTHRLCRRRFYEGMSR